MKNLLLSLSIIFIFASCNLFDSGPNPETESFIGDYYSRTYNADSSYKQIDCNISYTKKNQMDIELISFPGPMYSDSMFDVQNLKVTFDEVALIDKKYLHFTRVTNGSKDGKFVYRAKFEVIVEKTPGGLQLLIDVNRLDAPGILLRFIYQLTKK